MDYAHRYKNNRSNSTRSPASGAGNFSESRLMLQVWETARSRVRVDHVYAVGAREVPVFVCLRSNCNHVTFVGWRTVRFVRFALKVVVQNEGDLVGVIPLFFWACLYFTFLPPAVFIRHTLTTAVEYPTAAVSYFSFATSTETVHVT